MDKVKQLLDKYKMKYDKCDLKPNYIYLPKNILKYGDKDIEIFNEFYRLVLDSTQEYSRIVRTPSGGICIKNHVLKFPSYDVRATKNGVELVLLTGKAMCRIMVSTSIKRDEEHNDITGTQAWRIFIKTLKDFNINIEDYRISEQEGLELKKDIPYKKFLYSNAFKDLEFDNVHHIDFNSSFPAGLVNNHPEFKEAINYLYVKRHDNKIYKSILNNSISGYMQSKYVKYGFAHLCKEAILDNYNRIDDMRQKLEDSGRIPLLCNIDGIWYKGDVYHDENEGTELGQYKNDYINCRFRAKSPGAYEFEDKDGYHPKVSGTMRLERVKPKSQWVWGDIYNSECEPVKYQFREGVGIYEKEESNW